MKARGTMLIALPNKDQLKFHSYKDAKLLKEAIEKRYGGKKESKKVQRTLLKQHYENFVASSSETLYQTFDRNKADIETISLDNLYNNLKIYEPELTRSSSTSQNPQNVAFVSSNSTNSTRNTNEADNTAFGVSTVHSQEQINLNDLEEMDLHWVMAMLTIRARRFIKRTCRNLDINGQKIGFDRSKVKCFDCHKNGHFARECRALKNQENRGREYNRKTMPVENPIENPLIAQDGIIGDNALVENTKKLEKAEKVRDELKLTLEKFQNSSKSLNNLLENQVSDKVKIGLGYKAVSPAVESFMNSSKMLENQENVKSRSDKGYHAVPPPYTGNCIPPKPNLMFIDKQVNIESVDVVSNVASSDVKTVESKHESVDMKNKGVYITVETKLVRKNNFSPLIIEDWNSDDESKVEFKPKVEGNPQQKEYKEKGIIDTGCSRNMTRNKLYLSDYEDYDGGFVSFGDGKGRIYGKGKIQTGTLDFDDVYFCKKLKYILFRIGNQLDCKVKDIRCDNGTEFKNSVMNQFCDMKEIKREFSVARTPQ
nr:hypothetical protein [Tanacetum cinerariifolium]